MTGGRASGSVRFLASVLLLCLIVSFAAPGDASGPISKEAGAGASAGHFTYRTDETGLCITGYEGYVPESLTVPQEIDGVAVASIGDWAFSGEDALKRVVLPDCLEQIGDSSFRDCSSLVSVVMSQSGIREIGEYAFAFCGSLREITLPDSLSTLGESAFWHCSSLESVSVPFGVSELADGAFGYCEKLREISLPETVAKIGELSLAGSALNEISLPVSVTEFGHSTFTDSANLTKLNVTGPVKDIPSGFASDCPALETVILPETIENIGQEAFSHCGSLENISLPASVREIGPMAFWSCTSLQSVNVPEGVATIEFGTWWGCTILQSLGIPSSVNRIDAMAFFGAPLKNVYYSGSQSDWDRIDIESDGHDQFGNGIKDSNHALTEADIHYNEYAPVLPAGVSIRSGSLLSAARSGLGPVLLGFDVASPADPITVSVITSQFETPEGTWWTAAGPDGRAKSPDDTAGTGDVLTLQNSTPVGFCASVVLTGDVTGSGILNLSQVVRIAQAFSGAEPLQGIFLMAGDFTGTGTVTLTDVIREAQMYTSSADAGLNVERQAA